MQWLCNATDTPPPALVCGQPLFDSPDRKEKRDEMQRKGEHLYQETETSLEMNRGPFISLWPERHHVATSSCKVSQELLQAGLAASPNKTRVLLSVRKERGDL